MAASSSWAVIGAGRVAPAHVTSLHRSGVEVIGAVEPDAVAAATFSARYDLPVWPSIAAMLAERRPAAATVAVPHDAHLAVIDELLRAGVAALSEKPLAATAEECLAVVQAEQETGIPVGAILNMRGLPYARALHRAAAGRLTVRRVDITGDLVRRPSEGWQSDATRAGGGILMEVGIHFLDLCTWWFGDPQVGRCSVAGEPVEHSADASVRFGSGVDLEMSLRAVHEVGQPVTIRVTADEGALTVSGARVLSGAQLLLGPGDPTHADLSAVAPLSEDLPYGDGHVQVIREAVEMFDRQGSFPVTARDGAVSVALASALYGGNEDLAAAIAPFAPSRSGSA